MQVASKIGATASLLIATIAPAQLIPVRCWTLVAWFNHHSLLEPVGYIPPAEAEANYYRQLASQITAVDARRLHENRGGSVGEAGLLMEPPRVRLRENSTSGVS